MSLIKVSKIMERIKKNPIASSGMVIKYGTEGIVINVENAAPLGIAQAKILVEWMAEVIGGVVKWEDEQECKVLVPQVTTKPTNLDLSEVLDPDKIYLEYEGFDVIPVTILTKLQKGSSYLPCLYVFSGDRISKARLEEDLTKEEYIMLFEDRFFAGLPNRDLKYKYHLNHSAISPIMQTVISQVGSPKDYTPQYAIKAGKEAKSKVAKTASKKEKPTIITQGFVLGSDMKQGLEWAGIDNKNIKRMTSFEISTARDQDKARKINGLPRLKVKLRKCIACKKPFETTSEYNCGCNYSLRRAGGLEDSTGATI